MPPMLLRQRIDIAEIAQPYAINAMSHQGFMHDERRG